MLEDDVLILLFFGFNQTCELLSPLDEKYPHSWIVSGCLAVGTTHNSLALSHFSSFTQRIILMSQTIKKRIRYRIQLDIPEFDS